MYRARPIGPITHYVAFTIWRIVNKVQSAVQSIRYASYHPQFAHVGEDVVFDDDIYINKPENISIGDGVFLGQSCYLNAVDGINIGDECLIAAGCKLMTWNHRIDNKKVALRENGNESAPVTLGDGVWLGYDAIVLPGVTIGDGAVVGAGAVVTDDVDPFTIVGGVPASPIGKRTEDGVVLNE